uniref:GCFC domain-containing protein n=1 Tax=Bursaphelenchus xylophilus TaxID=6326 RepID=A0A1I7SP74_BURXY
MRDFLDANIVPKLESSLFNMNINPLQNKKYEEFNVLLAWRGLLQDDVICRILTRNFFSRWYNLLFDWLQVPGDPGIIVPEVANYYREWKGRVPQELHQWPPIQSKEKLILSVCRENNELYQCVGKIIRTLSHRKSHHRRENELCLVAEVKSNLILPRRNSFS